MLIGELVILLESQVVLARLRRVPIGRRQRRGGVRVDRLEVFAGDDVHRAVIPDAAAGARLVVLHVAEETLHDDGGDVVGELYDMHAWDGF